MLINLSNHPFASWQPAQSEAALAIYKEVEDMAFPAVPPAATTEDVHALAAEFCAKILAKKPVAVHVMGELTFCHALVNALQGEGIPCIASTTERIVIFENDGTKHSNFRFAGFRGY